MLLIAPLLSLVTINISGANKPLIISKYYRIEWRKPDYVGTWDWKSHQILVKNNAKWATLIQRTRPGRKTDMTRSIWNQTKYNHDDLAKEKKNTMNFREVTPLRLVVPLPTHFRTWNLYPLNFLFLSLPFYERVINSIILFFFSMIETIRKFENKIHVFS